MAETEKKFSELTAAAVLTDADILAISQIDSATASLMSKRTTLIAIANKLAILTNYTSELTTQDKTLTGAINELKGLISLIPHFGIEVVQTLPTEDISETTIYMTPSQNPQTQDAYDEFIYVNDAWEHVGSTAVDLSAYYTKLEVDGLLATKANTADVSAALALKENTADLEEDVTDIVVDLTDTIETAEGNPVTLQTVQEGYAKAVTIKLTPKQDLHGYDKPWPGGAGKNQMPDTSNETKTHNGITIKSENGVYAISGTATGGSDNIVFTLSTPYTIKSGDYLHFFNTDAVTGATVNLRRADASSITAPSLSPINRIFNLDSYAGETIASIAFYITNNAAYTGTVSPMICTGSTATAYEPYSNICPIEGYEEASATRTGKNELNPNTFSGRSPYTVSGDTITVTMSDGDGWPSIMPTKMKAGTYTFSRTNATGRVYLRTSLNDYASDSMTINDGTASGTFTLSADCGVKIKLGNGATGSYPFTTKVQIELGTTATEYEPYDGATATAEFSETIYGAVGDIAGGEWEKEYKTIDLGTLEWTKSDAGNNKFRFLADLQNLKIGQSALGICDSYARIATTYMSNADGWTFHGTVSRVLFFIDKYSDYTTTQFKAAMSGVQFAYELATPEPFQTAPAPLTLRKGNNTITTDGDSVKVKYNKLALPDIGGIGRYISALEARVAALEGNGNRSLSLMKSAPIEMKEEETTEEPKETEEETKNEK